MRELEDQEEVIAEGTVAGRYNVRDHGAVGDRVTDDAAAINAIIENAPEGSEIFFPAGAYIISEPLDCGSKAFMFRGINCGAASAGSADKGSVIVGDFPEPIIKIEQGTSRFGVIDLGLINQSDGGTGIQASGITGSIQRVSINAYNGIIIPADAFMWTIDSCSLLGLNGPRLGSIGIYVHNHCFINGCDVTGFDDGVRLNSRSSLHGGRIETNNRGIVLGRDLQGNNWGWNGSLSGMSLEANDIGICIESGAGIISGCGMQGSTNSPSGGSISGVQFNAASYMLICGVAAGGAYSVAAWDFTGYYEFSENLCLIGCLGSNGAGDAWNIPQTLATEKITFISCNNPA